MESNENLLELIQRLQEKVETLELKYQGLLWDVKHLEEENVENSNLIYELSNSLEAVDRRIDIIAEEFGET